MRRVWQDTSTVHYVEASNDCSATAASDKRTGGFSGGEDVILDINKLNLTVIKQCYVVNCYMHMVEKKHYVNLYSPVFFVNSIG